MKRIYQAPELQITEIQMQDGILLGTSEREVTGTDGGWVKGESSSSSTSSYNVWDDDWSKD